MAEISARKVIKMQNDVVQRLKASKAKGKSEDEKDAYEAGVEWAKQSAEWKELERLAEAEDDQGLMEGAAPARTTLPPLQAHARAWRPFLVVFDPNARARLIQVRLDKGGQVLIIVEPQQPVGGELCGQLVARVREIVPPLDLMDLNIAGPLAPFLADEPHRDSQTKAADRGQGGFRRRPAVEHQNAGGGAAHRPTPT